MTVLEQLKAAEKLLSYKRQRPSAIAASNRYIRKSKRRGPDLNNFVRRPTK